VTQESGRLLRHHVDETGALTELTGAGRTPLYRVGTAMAGVGVLTAFGLFVLLGFLGALAGMSLVPLGATLIRKDDLERRVPRSEPGTWYLLRTNREPRGDD
jgi:hypothetical protein